MPGYFYGSLPPSILESYKQDPRRALATGAYEAGTSTAPLRGGATEGVLRLANALIGAYQGRKLTQEYQRRGQDYNTSLATALAGIKPGHFDTDTRTYTPMDFSSVLNASQSNPDLADVSQQAQMLGLKTGLASDAAAQEAIVKQAFKDPQYTSVNGTLFADGKPIASVPKQFDPDAAAARQESLALRQQTAAFQQQMALMNADMRRDSIETQKAAQRASSPLGQADKKRIEGADSAAESAQKTLAELGQAKGLVTAGVYGPKPSDRVAYWLHEHGLNPSAKGTNTKALEQIGANLVLANGSLGSGVSVYDAQTYAKAAGDFQNASNDADRIKAIETMSAIQKRAINNANTLRSSYQQTGTLPAFSQQAPEVPPQITSDGQGGWSVRVK